MVQYKDFCSVDSVAEFCGLIDCPEEKLVNIETMSNGVSYIDAPPDPPVFRVWFDSPIKE